jgi:subtilisin-like proprotein convertase family protein
MKNIPSRFSQLAVAAAAIAVLTLAQPAHAVVTACVASGGSNCTALIPDGPQPALSSTLIVPAGICGAGAPIGVNVSVNATHSWVGDLSISVKNPLNVPSTLLTPLPDPPAVSCSGDDIVATFHDGGAAPVCSGASVPSVGGTLAPATALAPLAVSSAAVTGVWTLTVTDNAHGNTGALNDWSVDVVCGAADMSVALNGFPVSAYSGTPVTGTITCTNVGTLAATNVTCSVNGATSSGCVLQPGGTPVAAFPVASVAPGGSITCNVQATMPDIGPLSITGSTSAANDVNTANNSTADAVPSLGPATPQPAPMLTWLMQAMLLLGLLVAGGIWRSKNRQW